MFEISIRFLSLLLVVLASFLDAKQTRDMVMRPWAQVVMGVLLILVIVSDPIAGLMCAVAAMILYIRISDVLPKETVTRDGDFEVVKTPYVTAEFLRSAQSNIVNQKEMDTGIKGFKGVYGEAVYGAQGLDADLPGFTPFL